MEAEVEVLKPGLLSTIQDSGRFGYAEFGVPVSGAMDLQAAGLANAFLRNSADAAVMEISIHGPKLRFSASTSIVITGAELSPAINGEPISNNRVFVVGDGDVISFGKRISGCRAYLGIRQGFQTKKILNSRSWFSAVTGVSRLEKGMKLAYISFSEESIPHYATVKPENYLDRNFLNVFRGPEYDQLSQEQKNALLNSAFRIGKNNSRMGVQLQEKVEHQLQPIITGPVLPGTVQLTSGGQLIVLMRDGQTTGGYPRVLQLSQLAINMLAQKVQGQEIFFLLQDLPVH